MPFSDKSYELFFDQECLQALPRREGKYGVCPVELVDQSMDAFFGSLRIESQFSGYVGVKILFVAANQGGIPDPKDSAGTMFWAMWMFVAGLQYAITLLSLLMVRWSRVHG